MKVLGGKITMQGIVTKGLDTLLPTEELIPDHHQPQKPVLALYCLSPGSVNT